MKLTWSECMYLRGADSIQKRFFNKLNKLIIVGRGFDPRMTVGVSSLFNADPHCTVLVINYTEKQSIHNPTHIQERDKNVNTLKKLCGNNLIEVAVEIWNESVGCVGLQRDTYKNN